MLFARAEGLHAHGHSKEACILGELVLKLDFKVETIFKMWFTILLTNFQLAGVKLAEELLANPPNLMIEVPQLPKKKGKRPHLNPATHQLSVLASATLSKGAFLCSVLSENPEHFHLAFRYTLNVIF